MSLFSPKQHRIFTVLHIFATLITATKAVDKFMHHKPVAGVLISIAAVSMLLFVFLHNKIEAKKPMLLPWFFIIEAGVISIVAGLSWGKGYFWIYLVAVALYLFTFFRIRKMISEKLKKDDPPPGDS